MANEAQARGSEKLLAQLAKKGGAATLEEVKLPSLYPPLRIISCCAG
jgi:hypothetical protein